MAEKLNASITPSYPVETVEVLIHSGKETLHNTLNCIKPINIKAGRSKTIMITKSNLNSISTVDDPCADDKTLTRADAAIKKVKLKTLNVCSRF